MFISKEARNLAKSIENSSLEDWELGMYKYIYRKEYQFWVANGPGHLTINEVPLFNYFEKRFIFNALKKLAFRKMSVNL